MKCELAKIYVEICKIRYQQFNKRRDFEFKICLSIWTMLVVVIAFLYKTELTTNHQIGSREYIILLGLFSLISLFGYWLFRIHKANHTDIKIAILASEFAEIAMEVKSDDSILTKAEVGTWNNSKTDFNQNKINWRFFFVEFLITISLAVVALSLVFFK